MDKYKIQFEKYYDIANGYLVDALSKLDDCAPKVIVDAMNYAVMNGGKRIRAILCLATADILGVPHEKVKEYCVAIECIHAYSLVHDDLPAMDNDDFRRGKPSTHKAFGEANAILTGDALLNYAFELCLNKTDFNSYDAKALYALAQSAGYSGMIAGQVLDLENEDNAKADEKVLFNIYLNKTAKLITAPIMVASHLSGGEYCKELNEYGINLGLTFQIIDDVMDVEGTFESIGKTPHKDEKSDKLTSVKIFGLDGAKMLAKDYYEKCKTSIKNVPNNEFLIALADAMYIRRK